MISSNLEQILIISCFYSLFCATVFFCLKSTIFNLSFINMSGSILMLISSVLTTIVLLNRWFVSKHFPLSNLYESTIFLTWSLIIVYFFLYKKNNNEWLGIIIAPTAMLTYGFGILGLPSEMQKVTLLIPSLKSYWLMMHVSMMILSYAALLCGSLLSMTLLVINTEILFNLKATNNSQLFTSQLPYIDLEHLCFNKKINNLLKELDYWSFRSIGIGFPLLTIGIMSGAVWANEAWGSYWSWDPKETWAFITWLVFAIYLHSRIIPNNNKENSSIIASFGFLMVWICYLGVNLLGKGLHSYGWFS